MTIVTRYNHTYPSSYVPIGLDATVSYMVLWILSSVMIPIILYILQQEWMVLPFGLLSTAINRLNMIP